MNEAEFDKDDIFSGIDKLLRHQRVEPAFAEDGVDLVHPSENHARDARKEFENNIQRPLVLVFFERCPNILSQPKGRDRIINFKSKIFEYFKDSARALRRQGKNGDADVLETTDCFVISDIVKKHITEEIKRLGNQIPETDGYRRIDSRIKFLDRWDKLCDELVDLEKSGGTD